MLDRLPAVVAASFICLTGAGVATEAEAQGCGGTYTVKRGDSLSAIADAQYKDVGKWSAIYQSNVSAIGENPERIAVGMTLNLTCIDGLPVGLEGGVDIENVVAVSAPLQVPLGNPGNRDRINLLTGDDYAPFTDRDLPSGGLFTELVKATMEDVDPEKGWGVNWVNDWSAHFEPLLSNAFLEMSFPWIKPDCENDPATYRCANLVFSEPMFEMLILLFTNTSNPMTFTRDQDVFGKTLCRPEGYATFFFDHNGRNWLREEKITLLQPGTPNDCFEMLAEGEVDGVVMNEFTGRQKISELSLEGVVDVAAGIPINIDGLHIVAHKDHPEAIDLISMVNEGLDGIRESGEYQRIVDEHMTRIWAGF
ncbi:MAG: transporter substrate-binding domain-containing protein [Pseudomonadota bacterium]